MPVLLAEDLNTPLPPMFPVKQHFRTEKLTEIEETVHKQFHRDEIFSMIEPGMKIVVAVGSRGICNLSRIVKQLILEIKEVGAFPVILGAMGSHGGGTEEGQMEILHSYQITEEEMGCPVLTRNDVTYLGSTSQGIKVYFDTYCLQEADLIIPVNRVKLHTDFVDTIQSGLCKMISIGLGHHKGCSALHESPFASFGQTIRESSKIILQKTAIGFGLAIVENAYDQTALIEAVTADSFIEREEALVKISQSYMPQLMIPEIDLLIVEQIGKDISGAGYDPNILGKSYIRDEYLSPVPSIQKMVLLGISKASHGNGIGLGAFDVITRNLFDQLDLDAIYTNAVAIKVLEDCKIPLIAADEDSAIRIGIKTLRNVDPERLKIVRIKDTLHLDTIYVSEALFDVVKNNKDLSFIE